MGFEGASAAQVEELIVAAHAATDALVAIVDGVVDDVKAKTDNLPAIPADEAGLVVAVKAKTDNLPTDPADQSDLEDILGRKYPFLDFWSLPKAKITIPGAAADLDFPSVEVVGFPSGATIKRVVPILTSRALRDTSAADNYIDLASKTLRVMKAGGAWGTDDVVGITFDQNSLYCVASQKENGPTIIGSDVKSEVDENATYNFRSEETERGDAISALADNLELYGVQTGLRFFYE